MMVCGKAAHVKVDTVVRHSECGRLDRVKCMPICTVAMVNADETKRNQGQKSLAEPL